MNVGNMAEALKARDEGMASSANHAETDAPGWGDRAYQAVISSGYLMREPQWHMEFAREWCYACGLDRPAEERAWGSVTQRLIRDGRIEPVGYWSATSSNGSIKRTYRIVA